jgi:Ni/Co efflux regulator RcnB
MRHTILKSNWAWALIIAGVLAAGQSLADKPAWAGNGNDKGGRGDSDDRSSRDHDGATVRRGEYFDDHRRTVAHDYYREEYRGGHCPPGLAKKHNGCMPPGQARKWSVGRPLPREVIYYPLPPALIVQIGPPPTGYRYVRVASDILLIALGTGMVVDAMQDLGVF